MDPVAVTLSLALFVVVIAALMAGFPVAFTLAGVSLGFGLLASVFGLFDLSLFGALPQRIFAVMQSEILVAVPLFVFMGVVLERSRVAENLLNAVTSTLGSTRGGLGIAVCLVGALMAASTGIVGATVVTMGLISLPAMLKAGYRPSFAAGTIAASGTLGQIIPPSIVLIILGDQLAGAYSQAQYRLGNFAPDAVSVNDLFAGALIPGLLLVSLYIVWILLRTWLNPDVAPPLNQRAHDQHPHAPNLMRSLIAPLSLIVAVLGSILGGLASPTEAASIGAVGAILLAGLNLAEESAGTGALIKFGAAAMIAMLLSTWAEGPVVLKLIAAALTAVGIICALVWMAVSTEDDGQVSLLTSSMRQTLRMTSMIFLVLIGASVFSLVFRGVGGDDVIEHWLSNLPGGVFGALLVVMLTMFLLGFVLDFLEIVFIVVPIVAPVLLMMEVSPGVTMSPVWLAVLIAVNLQTSFLTPPFGFALFYLRGVAPDSVKTSSIYTGILPFVAIQLLVLALIWWFPALATWLPGL